MINKSFIFLSGHHRSGTSLLHEILREHDSISGFSGTGVPEDEGQHLQSVFHTGKFFGGPGKYIFNEASHMDENHFLATDQNAEKLMQEWGQYYDSSCNHYIEKSPPNLVRTRFFQKLFPNSKFIAILRHPIAVGFATQKWSRTSIESLIDHSLLGYELFSRDLHKLTNAYVLRYEDFVQDPQRETDKIFKFLQLPTINISHQVRQNVNDKYFEMWNEHRSKLFNKVFKKISKRTEERANMFGYSINNVDTLSSSSILGEHKKNTIKKPV